MGLEQASFEVSSAEVSEGDMQEIAGFIEGDESGSH